MSPIIESLQSDVQRILPEITALRHELHQHPEVRFEELWTSDRIAQFLQDAGVPFTRGHAGGTGIVAVIEGASPGPTIALRADMDALEIEEQTGLPHASTIPGRMHACGHDGHMACLAGAVKVLLQRRPQLRGRVKCIFQPAEEQAAGGRLIVEEGLLDDVSAAFALHGWPQLPLGTVGVGSGCVMAGADFFRIEVIGKGGHGADPAATVDPIVIASHIVLGLQSIVSRETNPWDAAVVSIARIGAGTASNIIPATAWMEGTFRTLGIADRDRVMEAIRRIATNTAAAFRARAEVLGCEHGYPPTINEAAASAFAADTVRQVFGQEALIPITHSYMTAEDFSFYLQRVPGAFLFLGNAKAGAEAPGLHTAHYDFGDSTIPIGVSLLSALALRSLTEDS